ncbi:MAG: acyl-CoA desaturase, partial [Myxococcota bacterium]|nr:acyl-CoA desaturase [Myxococcota bacterium]
MSLPLQQESTPAKSEPQAGEAERAARPQERVEAPAVLSEADGLAARADKIPQVIYWAIHASCLAVFWVGVDATALLLFAATFWGRMFGITGGYHRYFAHRSYRTSRAFQLALAVLGATAIQKGPLWWAGIHRRHHRYADGPGDTHSPRDGLWYAHQDWVFDPRWNPTPVELVRDLERYPELRWLNRWHFVPPATLALLCWAIGGGTGLLWGFAISTTLLWHATYCVNSFAHIFGSRRFETEDTSRNNWWIALLTMGEGWHNNHHHYMASARQGFRWWEIDVTYYLLRG